MGVAGSSLNKHPNSQEIPSPALLIGLSSLGSKVTQSASCTSQRARSPLKERMENGSLGGSGEEVIDLLEDNSSQTAFTLYFIIYFIYGIYV